MKPTKTLENVTLNYYEKGTENSKSFVQLVIDGKSYLFGESHNSMKNPSVFPVENLPGYFEKKKRLETMYLILTFWGGIAFGAFFLTMIIWEVKGYPSEWIIWMALGTVIFSVALTVVMAMYSKADRELKYIDGEKPEQKRSIWSGEIGIKTGVKLEDLIIELGE